jgi:hypothetical protein
LIIFLAVKNSTMTHLTPQWLILLHNDSLDYSFKFFHIPSESSKFFYYILAYGNFAYVSRGFSIKGRPDLAQDSSSIFFQIHHQSFPLWILKSSSTVQYTVCWLKVFWLNSPFISSFSLLSFCKSIQVNSSKVAVRK